MNTLKNLTMSWIKFIRMKALLEIFKKGVQLVKATERVLKKPDSPGFCGKFLFAKIENSPILELTNVNG